MLATWRRALIAVLCVVILLHISTLRSTQLHTNTPNKDITKYGHTVNVTMRTNHNFPIYTLSSQDQAPNSTMYLKNYNNPCFYERLPNDPATMYNYSLFDYYRLPKEHLARYVKDKRSGRDWRLRCVPSVYILGPQKTGTSDLTNQLVRHPLLQGNLVLGHESMFNKEPHFWNILRYSGRPFSYYLDFYDHTSNGRIQNTILTPEGQISYLQSNKEGFDNNIRPGRTFDATPSYFWDNRLWKKFPGNKGLTQPKYFLPHTIQRVVPDAKFIISLRDPVDRMYSDYKYFMWDNPKSQTLFHNWTLDAIQWFRNCENDPSRTLLNCLYDRPPLEYKTLVFTLYGWGHVDRLRIGLYYHHIKQWLSVFPKEQIFIFPLSRYSRDKSKVLKEIIKFIGVDYYSEDYETYLREEASSTNYNGALDRKSKYTLGPMLEATRVLLNKFYDEYNVKLFNLLNEYGYDIKSF